MPKTKVKKEEIIAKLETQLASAKAAVLVNYKGMKVSETEELRKILREKGVSFNVTKNTLVKIVLTKHGIKFDASLFEKPIAIAFANTDEVVAAKEIELFAKKNEAIEILGGILENKMIDTAMVKRLAALPSREELLGRIVGSIASPLSGMVNVLSGNLRGLVNVLKAASEKQASQ
ncbi:MAG: 50S ribosomal protein L10 [bacterium]|nr:50S ribosomal protein L10 [bacterium]